MPGPWLREEGWEESSSSVAEPCRRSAGPRRHTQASDLGFHFSNPIPGDGTVSACAIWDHQSGSLPPHL